MITRYKTQECGIKFFWQERLANEVIHTGPILPKDTLDAMLATLPSETDLLTEHCWPRPLREAIASVEKNPLALRV